MPATDLRTADFNYHLPERLIAQTPAPDRPDSRLMVLPLGGGAPIHDRFRNIGRYLASGDVLVANRSRVIPARLAARKSTGGQVELLLTRSLTPVRWRALARPSKKLRAGMRLAVDGAAIDAVLLDSLEDGEWEVEFRGGGDVPSQILAAGTLPLPPYIHNTAAPLDRYQTVYADRDGSIAAPTAGLHFSDDLLDNLRVAGITICFVTLHVGVGTFKPVSADRIAEHRMHAEWGEVPPDVADTINTAHARGSRVIAVGTTTTRLLETAFDAGAVRPYSGETALFIYPGYQFRAVDGLVTNFHLPKSTLLMLVSALAGRERILDAYTEAVREEYRFFSFGDAMLLV